MGTISEQAVCAAIVLHDKDDAILENVGLYHAVLYTGHHKKWLLKTGSTKYSRTQ